MARDLRKYARQTNVQMTIGLLLLVFLVGDGLIYLLYGQNAAVMGLICLGLGLIPALIVWASLAVMEVLVNFSNRE